MSYARFGRDGSDVYVFTSSLGIECCGCLLQESEWVDEPGDRFWGGYLKPVGEIVPHVFRDHREMIAHLERHRATGHTVPQYVFDRLNDQADQERNRKIWAGEDAS